MTNHKYTEEYTIILNDNEYRAVDVALNKLLTNCGLFWWKTLLIFKSSILHNKAITNYGLI